LLARLEDAVAAHRGGDALARVEVARRVASERAGREAERRAGEAAEVGAVAGLAGLADAVAADRGRGREQEPAADAERRLAEEARLGVRDRRVRVEIAQA